EARLQHHHLQDLVPLLLTAGEALVDGSAEKRRVHLQGGEVFTQDLEELTSRGERFTTRFALCIQCGTQKVGVTDTRNLEWILECEEDALDGTLLRAQTKNVLTVEGDRTADVIALPTRDDMGERAFARAVRTHDGMDLTGGDLQIE